MIRFYSKYSILIRKYPNKIKRQFFGILNFGHCDLPFGLAQGGGDSFDFAQDRELVEPFGICDLVFEIFNETLRPLQYVVR